MQVISDQHLIMLRQSVRQASRLAGLGAAQQARLTAAISEVARALLSDVGASIFTIRTSEELGARPALEVICVVSSPERAAQAGRVYRSEALAGARALVDDTKIAEVEPSPELWLRMWLVQ